MTHFTATEAVRQTLSLWHIEDAEFQAMCTGAALFRGPDGINRRYYQWLFQIDGTQVVSMGRVHPGAVQSIA